MTQQLLELADRCEKAAAPDRELDADIYYAVTGDEPVMIFADSYGPNEPVQQVGFAQGKYVSRFTRSIDAAMTLVPKGKYWLCGFGKVRANEPFGGAQILEPETSDEIAVGQGATVALALCAAALRARASSLHPTGAP